MASNTNPLNGLDVKTEVNVRLLASTYAKRVYYLYVQSIVSRCISSSRIPHHSYRSSSHHSFVPEFGRAGHD